MPKFGPFRSLRIRQLGQGFRAAHAGEVGVLLPVRHAFDDEWTSLVRLLFQQLPIGGQVGAQPIEGLPAEASTLFEVSLIRILALAATGQSRRAGGVVAVLMVEVVGQFSTTALRYVSHYK